MRRDGSRRDTRGFSSERAPSLLDDLQILLGNFCREWGFCNALADDLIVEGVPLTADSFATAVLRAEGWPEPELEWEWRPRFKKAFVARYGAEVTPDEYARRWIGR
ncbi:MAG TPA: hypothetical protein VF603_04965 [Allosphingosinicella sp.]|jgi:hypothetical protein